MVRRLIAMIVLAGCGRIGFDSQYDIDPAATVRSVAAGDRFSCALRDGHVWCWGNNHASQLGRLGGMPSATPVEIPGIPDAIAIDAGQDFACALRAEGGVVCWGANDQARLGSPGPESAVPIKVIGLPGPATQLSVGWRHACALFEDRSAWCWGNNSHSQIQGQQPINDAPPARQPIDNLIQIVAGDYDTLAVRGDGSVWSWGYEGNARLGRPGGSSPGRVPDLRASSVAAFSTACAVDAGRVRCWGDGGYGTLGDGRTGTESSIPTAPLTITGEVTATTVGEDHVCALLADRTVWCWGRGRTGELGVGDVDDRVVPAPTSLRDVVSISAAAHHTCAMRADDSVVCWGEGSSGELGDGTLGAYTPHQIGLGGAAVLSVAAGDRHTCAVAGNVWCWGSGIDGEIGDGATIDRAAPTSVALPGAIGVAAGARHSCAWTAAGVGACWGENNDGELGIGMPDPSTIPKPVVGLANVTRVVAGQNSSCAIAGMIPYCWGVGGALGDGTQAHRESPVMMAPTYGLMVSDISTAAQTTCVINVGAFLYCTGSNSRGQLGDGTSADTTTAMGVAAVGTVSRVATGTHTCAELMAGGLACWGANDEGQLGDGTHADARAPVPVVNLAQLGAGGLGTGELSTCASTVTGVQCWGGNELGELGDGTSLGRDLPAAVSGLGPVTQLSVGAHHACAIASNTLWCWGDNTYGQQGTGTFGHALLPVGVSGLGPR